MYGERPRGGGGYLIGKKMSVSLDRTLNADHTCRVYIYIYIFWEGAVIRQLTGKKERKSDQLVFDAQVAYIIQN